MLASPPPRANVIGYSRRWVICERNGNGLALVKGLDKEFSKNQGQGEISSDGCEIRVELENFLVFVSMRKWG